MALHMKEFKALEVDGIFEIETEHEEPTIYKLKIDDALTLSGLYHISKNTDDIVVFFNGATTGELVGKNHFMRWSWAYNAGISFISFDDPVVSCTKSTNLGWYIGTKNTDVQEAINEIIQHILDKNSIAPNRVIFYGSSGGGFAAIMAATRLRGSTAIAINPQTNILNYHRKSYEKLLKSFFHDNSVQDYSLAEYINRFSIIENITSSKYIPNIIYIQNTQDSFHVNNHYIPFHKFYINLTRGIGNFKNRLHIRLFNDEKGHSGISDKSKFLKERTFALSDFSEIETESIPTQNLLNKNSLSDKALWFDIDDASEDSEMILSLSLSNLYPHDDKKPAILLFECDEYHPDVLKENGLGFSNSFHCAFKYISNISDGDVFSLKTTSSISIKKIGIRRWQSTTPPILNYFTIKYSREVSFLTTN
jgi:hypothetical protein